VNPGGASVVRTGLWGKAPSTKVRAVLVNGVGVHAATTGHINLSAGWGNGHGSKTGICNGVGRRAQRYQGTTGCVDAISPNIVGALVRYIYEPFGSIARDLGALPVGKGEPVICVSAQVVWSMAYPDTSFGNPLAT
jgi:hypothetical protein